MRLRDTLNNPATSGGIASTKPCAAVKTMLA